MTLEQICDWLMAHPEAYAGAYSDDPAGRGCWASKTREHLERLQVFASAGDQSEDLFTEFLDALRSDPLIGPRLDRGILRYIAESWKVSDPNDSASQQRKIERVMNFIANEFIKGDDPKVSATATPRRPDPPTEPAS